MRQWFQVPPMLGLGRGTWRWGTLKRLASCNCHVPPFSFWIWLLVYTQNEPDSGSNLQCHNNTEIRVSLNMTSKEFLNKNEYLSNKSLLTSYIFTRQMFGICVCTWMYVCRVSMCARWWDFFPPNEHKTEDSSSNKKLNLFLNIKIPF